MLKKLFFFVLLGILFIPSTKAVEFDANEIRPIIHSDPIVQVEKNIIFDASSSFLMDKETPVTYEWDFGDGTKDRGEEVVHSYREAGEYIVTLTVNQQGYEPTSIAKDVFAYEKLTLMLTDASEKKETIQSLQAEARQEGKYIHIIESYDSSTAFISEESLFKKLSDQVGMLYSANDIVTWTTKGSGLNALVQLIQQANGEEKAKIMDALHDKSIVVITGENINTLSRILQSSFNIIQPKQIIITRQYELKNFIMAETPEAFLSELKKGISEYKVLNEETSKVSVFNFISYLVNFMIAKGIPSNTIVLLLMLPIIATIIAFLKQMVGITTFGLYMPSIVTLSFLALGLKFGLAILFIIIISGALLRKLLDRFRLLHIPRIAIILTFSTLIILITLAFGTYLGVSRIASIAVFPMLIMTTLAEKFVTALSGRGFVAALLLMVETAAVSLVCYAVVSWGYLQTLILGRPELILLLLLVNYLLGRWTGLRLMEYLRFREVMKHTEE